MNGMMSDTSMMGMCIVMILLFTLFIGLIIYLVVHFLMKNSRVLDHPLFLLKERYIKGEITEEEYEHIRKVINKK